MKQFMLLGIIIAYSIQGYAGYPGCRPEQPQLVRSETTIQSPGFKEGQEYPGNLECAYVIVAPHGKRIRLSFEHFDLEATKLCKADFVRIHEGTDVRQPVHGIFCGSQTPRNILSVGRALLLIFRTDFVGSAKGFSIRVRFVDRYERECPGRQHMCPNHKCVKESQICDGKDDCGDGADEARCSRRIAVSKFDDLESFCGRPAIEPTFSDIERIVGGHRAEPHSWPWQATLEQRGIEPSGIVCGGTLLNEQWVLTAAHCFHRMPQTKAWRVVLGNHNLFVKEPGEQTRYIHSYKIYSSSKNVPFRSFYDINHDLALVKLNAPVNITKTVIPACLPESGYEPTSADECYATGWGLTRGTGSLEELKQVKVDILEDSACKKPGQPITFNSQTMICGGIHSGGHGVCHGDSGGPLVCRKDGRWNIMGVVSFGTAGNLREGLCGLSEKPSAFSKVSAHINWIRKTIENDY